MPDELSGCSLNNKHYLESLSSHRNMTTFASTPESRPESDNSKDQARKATEGSPDIDSTGTVNGRNRVRGRCHYFGKESTEE